MFRNYLIFIALLLANFPQLAAQTFNDFLLEFNACPVEKRQAKVDSFLRAPRSFPITEDTLAHFIYSGPGQDVMVPGDFNGWDPERAIMINVEGTDFWTRTDTLNSAARLDYKFVYNSSTWILDPRNPFTCLGGFGPNSELRMPDYVPPPEIEYDADIPHGTIEDTTFASTRLGNSRRIQVYLPPGYDQGDESYAVVLIHDGGEYLNLANMDHVLDYLISEKRIDPVIAVFVPPVNRSPEYSGEDQDAFTQFIIEEVMPWIDGKYRTRVTPFDRATMGSSNGGNISLWIGMNHPEIFGNVGAFSSYVEPDIQTFFENNDMLDLRIYMNLGLYDHLTVIHSSVNGLVPVLGQKGYDYLFEIYPEGHSYGFWRAHLDDALEMFFPYSGSAVKQQPSGLKGFQLNQNFPNPFNPETLIRYDLMETADVNLTIYNICGTEIKTFPILNQQAGSHGILWDGTDDHGRSVSSGYYMARMVAESGMNRFVSVTKMVLIN
ncbi:alpha/beta hydrolase-fold protein [bacterium]